MKKIVHQVSFLAFINNSPNAKILVIWRSEGRGDAQTQIVMELPVQATSFEQPNGTPSSYDGQLFRIIWQLELWQDKTLLETREIRVGVSTPDPYLRQGLQRNPFMLESYSQLKNLWLDVGASDAPKANAQTLWQFMGVKGAGKSSHLRYWFEQTGGTYQYYSPDWTSRWKFPPITPITYWDEADRIPIPILKIAFARAAKSKATVVVGTHRDLGQVAKQVGLLVQTIRLGKISPSQLQTWATLRIRASSLENGTNYSISNAEAEGFLEQQPDSWRELASLLHIHCALWVSKYEAVPLRSW